ncbi:hypothetical protein B7P43_G03465 [Cryptotermes secundus]|uniref:Uncharacterized protein n=1 Tax=Cryptotermes secundus TaxID=105785 RepID=A0A2J7RLN7_9NEOP|nr:hypothetical protein B7P43_G03465 [Cryptotermes secundus]
MRPWSLTTQTTTFVNKKKCRAETENEGGKDEGKSRKGKIKKKTTYSEKFQKGK